MTADGEGGHRRSGRRSSQPLQHIGIGGSGVVDSELDVDGDRDADEPDLDAPEAPAGPEPSAEEEPSAADARTARRTVRVRSTRASARRRTPDPRRSGLDRIRPRAGASASEQSARDTPPLETGPRAKQDPMGRAALYSSGPRQDQPLFGTFLVECSACRRETPVTAGDLLRLGIPSLHLLFLKRYPSLMRCPACGRRTWLRIHWRI
jgi:hypothetical protein